MPPAINHFKFIDCAIFTTYLVVTVLVGLRFAKGQKNIKSYFLADKGMGYIVVGVSVLAAFFGHQLLAYAPAKSTVREWAASSCVAGRAMERSTVSRYLAV